jgi:hypothetical protein
MNAFLWPRMFDALFARVLMSTLLRQILRFLCPHRFSWPHSGVHGQDYQVCLRGGTAFEYDTISMRRTGKVVLPTRAMSGQ